MKFKFDPMSGSMMPVQKEKIPVRKWNVSNEQWDDVRFLRESLAVATTDGYNHLCVCINGQWRDCGIITNYNALVRQAQGPIANFHQVWYNGYPIDKPHI